MSYKNFPMVPRVIFGRGSFNQLSDIIAPKRLNVNAPFIFLVDDVFKGNAWLTSRIPLSYKDQIIYISAEEEPKMNRRLNNDYRRESSPHVPNRDTSSPNMMARPQDNQARQAVLSILQVLGRNRADRSIQDIRARVRLEA